MLRGKEVMPFIKSFYDNCMLEYPMVNMLLPMFLRATGRGNIVVKTILPDGRGGYTVVGGLRARVKDEVRYIYYNGVNHYEQASVS